MAKSLTVADCVRQGPGRYNFGHSLYLIVRGGSVLWEKQFRQGGKLRAKSYGSAVGAAPVSLTQARALDAADWLERRGQRQVASNAKYHNGNGNGRVVAKLFSVARDQYLEAHAAEWSPEHRETLRAMLLRHTAPISDKPVGEITEDDVVAVISPIWKGPNSTTGNRVRGMVEHIISSTGRIADNPARWAVLQYRMARNVKSYVSKSRAMMPVADIPRFMAKLADDKSVQSRALQFIILTAARQDEALEAVASEIDTAAKKWTVPKERMKMQREHTVPLSDAAIKCLGKLHGGFVFSSKLGGRLSQQTTRELVPTGTVHGFRAAITSWAQSKDYDKEVRDFTIAHYPTDPNDKAYERADLFDQRRKLMDEWAAFVTGDGQ
jgi:integrase